MHADKKRHTAINAASGNSGNSSLPKDKGRQQSKQRLSSDSCEFFSIIERLKSMRMDSRIGEKIGFITTCLHVEWRWQKMCAKASKRYAAPIKKALVAFY